MSWNEKPDYVKRDFDDLRRLELDPIAAAVLAEREECARIAEQAIVGYGEHNAEADAALSSVAAAIRARGSK